MTKDKRDVAFKSLAEDIFRLSIPSNLPITSMTVNIMNVASWVTCSGWFPCSVPITSLP